MYSDGEGYGNVDYVQRLQELMVSYGKRRCSTSM